MLYTSYKSSCESQARFEKNIRDAQTIHKCKNFYYSVKSSSILGNANWGHRAVARKKLWMLSIMPKLPEISLRSQMEVVHLFRSEYCDKPVLFTYGKGKGINNGKSHSSWLENVVPFSSGISAGL